MRLLQQLHTQIHITRGTCPQGGPCLITGRLAGVKLLLALWTISRANCAAKIININPATYSDGVACFISMAKSWHTYLLLFTYLSGNSPTHTHTLKLNQNRFSRISWYQNLSSRLISFNYATTTTQKLLRNAAAAIWLTWKNIRLKLVMSCYICLSMLYGGICVKRGGSGVFTSLSLQVPASLLRQLQFAWTRAEIKHTPCAPNNNPDLCHWTTSHLTPHVASSPPFPLRVETARGCLVLQLEFIAFLCRSLPSWFRV